MARIGQKIFLVGWLLPCSLRSHRTANPRPKMGFTIFRLYPPTTLIQASKTMKMLSNSTINGKETLYRKEHATLKNTEILIKQTANNKNFKCNFL